jgi:hypothetical protein
MIVVNILHTSNFSKFAKMFKDTNVYVCICVGFTNRNTVLTFEKSWSKSLVTIISVGLVKICISIYIFDIFCQFLK